MFALSIYGTWKGMNKKLGIRSWGLGDKMKDLSCRYAIKMLPHHGRRPDFEVVRQLMDRPKSRRV
jgi:hypothetical protein